MKFSAPSVKMKRVAANKGVQSVLSSAEVEFLRREGIASGFFSLASNVSLRVIYVGTTPLVRLAASGPFCSIALEPGTGRVLEVVDKNPISSTLVNSSLPLFNASVVMLCERFPFAPLGSEPDVTSAAADQIAVLLREIDEPAVARGTFWDDIIEKIRMGDFSLEVLQIG